jgi:hypothetical protein
MRAALLLALALLAPLAQGLAPAPPGLPAPAGPQVRDLFGEVAAPLGAFPMRDVQPRALREEMLAYYAFAGAVPTPRGLAALDEGLATLPPEVQEALAGILAAVNVAAALRAEAFALVSVEEVAWAGSAALRPEVLSAQEQDRLAGIALRIDRAKMLAAGALVVGRVETALPALRAAAALPGAESLAWTDPSGTLQVAGTGDDVHAADRTVLLDLGGDDWWANNAGAMAPSAIIELFPGCFTQGALDCSALHPKRNGPAVRSLLGRACSANLIDPVFGAGDASVAAQRHLAAQAAGPDAAAAWAYASTAVPAQAAAVAATTDPDLACLPQGAGDAEPWARDFWTMGALADGDAHMVAVGVDLQGNDRVAPPKEFTFMNDGRNPSGCDTRGMGEAGKLWARNVTAGSGFAGIGVLWDEGGDDAYGGRSITQGVGHLGGVGVLVDRGASRDTYEGIRFAQGVGFVAALGLLHDDGGDDDYALYNLIPLWNEFEAFSGCDVSTRDGQGRSNILAVGALVDGGGNDVYRVQDHLAEGLLLPGASRNDPTTTQGSTGFRLNIGPSALHDLLAIGRGLLWDRGGGDDMYTRPGRGDACFASGGTFWDEGASPLSSLGPCA